MLFNSFDFALFLPIVFILYWFICNKNLKLQNTLIVITSYVFYGWWDWRFLSLILFSTLVDYSVGLSLKNETKSTRRKAYLLISIIVNLGFLGFFKYYNFFLDNFIQAFSFFGYSIKANSLQIILPVGISFYTFQTMSYTIDIYRKKLKPTNDFIAFAAFVSFFPQLVAGPIERATHLLPQFYNKRQFNYTSAINGLQQILWGLVKKIVIADSCAIYANQLFNNSAEYTGLYLVLGAIFFTFQIYGDFSGYSDIAIGTARLFGFSLMQNFAFPYFSRDMAEFWRRWHISLSTWFRDYVYIPLGGSRVNKWRSIQNTFIIFIVSGFWHGANWTFIIWGFLNAVYFIPLLITGKNRNNLNIVAQNKYLPSLKETMQITVTFMLIVFAWIFFRAENIQHSFSYIGNMLKSPGSFFLLSIYKKYAEILLVLIAFVIIEWIGRNNKFALDTINMIKVKPIRWIFYYAIIIGLLYLGGEEQEFIYFQF
jgi:D-alanyl-lipoteichoic acid acyltransferase DltB (MBOAT superfamily)